jgi:putative transposase
MPRKPRFFLPSVPVHAIQRGNNRQAIFFDTADYVYYLDKLKEASTKYDCQIHDYVLMTNHVHLLVTPGHQESLSRMFQYVGRFYVPYVNKTYNRSGTLWEGRFKACLVEEESYLINCYRYIELNPVRAGIINKPQDYLWSSYRANALNVSEELLTPHPIYLALGHNQERRKEAYKKLFQAELSDELLDVYRASVQSGTPLGGDMFLSKIEQRLKVRVGQIKRGRPKKGS